MNIFIAQLAENQGFVYEWGVRYWAAGDTNFSLLISGTSLTDQTLPINVKDGMFWIECFFFSFRLTVQTHRTDQNQQRIVVRKNNTHHASERQWRATHKTRLTLSKMHNIFICDFIKINWNPITITTKDIFLDSHLLYKWYTCLAMEGLNKYNSLISPWRSGWK